MKYLFLISLALLLAGIKSEGEDLICLMSTGSKDGCVKQKFQDGYQCCWVEGKDKEQQIGICSYMKKDDAPKMAENMTKEYNTTISVDCSGRYLIVASLMSLFLIF